MELDLGCFRPAERTQLQLRGMYEKAGYHKYHMGRFEEYSLYQENRGFLSSDQVITFTDLDGRLLALKPDVTLGIAKNAQPAPGECKKYYYVEKVYRPSLESHTFEEINQMGLECIGAVNDDIIAQVLELAVHSLSACFPKSRTQAASSWARMCRQRWAICAALPATAALFCRWTRC